MFQAYSVGESKPFGFSGKILSYKIIPGEDATKNEYLEGHKRAANMWKDGQQFTFWAYRTPPNDAEFKQQFTVAENSQMNYQRFVLMKDDEAVPDGDWTERFGFWAFDPDKGKNARAIYPFHK